jgi:hypothetical protein
MDTEPSTLLNYQLCKNQRVRKISDNRPGSSHESRKGSLTNLIEIFLFYKWSSKKNPNSLVLDTDRKYKSKESTRLV